MELKRPYKKLARGGFEVLARAPDLDSLADDRDGIRSPFIVYEEDVALGPAHSPLAAVVKFGHGRFAHWKGLGFIFSSSDGTEPVFTGRRYFVGLQTAPDIFGGGQR